MQQKVSNKINGKGPEVMLKCMVKDAGGELTESRVPQTKGEEGI